MLNYTKDDVADWVANGEMVDLLDHDGEKLDALYLDELVTGWMDRMVDAGLMEKN